MRDLLQSLAALEHLWERSLTVELIAEPLEVARWNEPAGAVRARMVEQNWDTMGLSSAGDDTKRVCGYITRESLRDGDCGQFRRDFDVGELVSMHMPIRDCLPRLVERRRLFALGRRGVDAIVTVADLQKQPVQLVLFGGVSLLEIALGNKIRRDYPDESWESYLSVERRDNARRLQDLRRQKDQELDLVACLQICDKATILMKQKEACRTFGFESKAKASEFFERVQDLRDRLAHAHDLEGTGGWEEVSSTFSRAEELLRILSEMKPTQGDGDAD